MLPPKSLPKPRIDSAIRLQPTVTQQLCRELALKIAMCCLSDLSGEMTLCRIRHLRVVERKCLILHNVISPDKSDRQHIAIFRANSRHNCCVTVGCNLIAESIRGFGKLLGGSILFCGGSLFSDLQKPCI